MNESDFDETVDASRNGNPLNELNTDTSGDESDSIYSEDVLNQNSDSDDNLEIFDVPDDDFEYSAAANESGYYSSDQLQEAIDRVFIDGFNDAVNRMEHELAELKSENWIQRDMNNHDLPENFHFNLAINDTMDDIAPYDLSDNCQLQNDDVSRKTILRNCQQLLQYRLCEEVDHGSDREPCNLRRLSAGSSRSWSPRFVLERQEGRRIPIYRRYSYPIINQEIDYPEMNAEQNDVEMDNLSTLLRLGLTTRNESPPERAARDPQKSPVLPRRQRRIRRGVKRYRGPRSLSRSSQVSTKRRRSLPPTATRRINVSYSSSSESDEEPMEEVAYIDTSPRHPQRLQSIKNVRRNRRRLSRPRNPRRHRRSLERYPQSRLYGRLHRVNSGRIRRKRT
ncbi:Voltage-dependent T-type calcium channel subunit alpha-1H [Dirofilaria immitis]